MVVSSGTPEPQSQARILNCPTLLAAVAVMALVGAGMLVLATRWGIGLFSDSIVYVGAARYVLAGEGFQFLSDIGELSPITQYPPGYPWLIALFGLAGLDALEAGRWVSVFFAAANAIIIAYIAYRATESFGATIMAMFLSFAAFPMVYINSQALSEPPFIFLILLGFCFLAQYLRESDRASLYWFALAIGMSCLVRYVGVAFGITGAAVILLHGQGSWRRRFTDAVVFSVLAALPIVTWVTRNYLFAGNAVNRTFGFHLPRPADLLPSLDTAAQWLLPAVIVEAAPWPSRLFLLAVLLAVAWLARNHGRSNSWHPRLMIYCVAGYAAFLFISFSFNDQPLYFDTRTMALPYLGVMIVALTILTGWLTRERAQKRSWRWFTCDCLLIGLLALQMINGVLWMTLSYKSGIGFQTESWRRSELIEFARQAPAPMPIISNAPDFIFTLTGRRANMIPHEVHPWTRRPNEHYAQNIAALGAQLKNDAVLIYFKDEDRLWYLPSIQKLEANLPLAKIKATSDGGIYRLQGAAPILAFK
jgi:hypothetical protein